MEVLEATKRLTLHCLLHDHLEVEVGDSKEPAFWPQVKMMKWGNEVNLSLRLMDAEPAEFIGSEGGKAVWHGHGQRACFYEHPHSEEHHQGAYEFEVELDERPASNTIAFSVRSKGLDFWYQGPLPPGEKRRTRPENVVGSYAVYHKTKQHHRLGDYNYRSGKTGHIYRPSARDASGRKVWCEFNTDLQETGILTVTIPQEFLDTAAYPILIDPTLGYTTIGASFDNTGGDVFIAANAAQTDSSGGTMSKIQAASWDAGGDSHIKMAVYPNGGGGTPPASNAMPTGSPIANSGSGSLTVSRTTKPTQDSEWTSSAGVSGSLSASTYYWLCYIAEDATVNIAYDDVSVDYNFWYHLSNSFSTFPTTAPAMDGHTTDKYSVYATYAQSTQDVSFAGSLGMVANLASTILTGPAFSGSLGMVASLEADVSTPVMSFAGSLGMVANLQATVKTGAVMAGSLGAVASLEASFSTSTPTVGWTEFTPSVDTVIIYVSATGSDSNDGLSSGAPVLTLAHGISLLTSGNPDWLLLKCGDSFEDLGTWKKLGRSPTEPMLISSYGTGARPIVNCPPGGAGLYRDLGGGSPSTIDHVAFVGLDFYAADRDPGNGTPTTTDSQGVYWVGAADNILFEDCAFRFNSQNVAFQIDNPQGIQPTDIAFRRCLFLDGYSTTSHAQGIFAIGINGLLIEECVFDHNGWNESVSGADRDIFQHNMYISFDEPSSNITIRGNISMRASSHGLQLRPGGIMDNNLFARNAIAAFTAEAASEVTDNVVLESDDIDGSTPRGWGIQVLTTVSTLFDNNIFAHKISADGGGYPIIIESPNNDVTLTDNIIEDWATDGSGPIVLNGITPTLSSGNIIENAIEGDGTATFPDENRDLATYVTSLGDGTTFDDYAAEVRQQSKQNWRTEYTAAAANDYIRAGFGISSGLQDVSFSGNLGMVASLASTVNQETVFAGELGMVASLEATMDDGLQNYSFAGSLGMVASLSSFSKKASKFSGNLGMVATLSGFPPTTLVVSGHLDGNQVLKAACDTGGAALALKMVDAGTASGAWGSMLDAAAILARVNSDEGIRYTLVSGSGEPGGSRLDRDQIIKDVYDSELNALRMREGATERDVSGWTPDAAQMWKFIHIPEDHALAKAASGSASGEYGTVLDAAQVEKGIMAMDTGLLRATE